MDYQLILSISSLQKMFPLIQAHLMDTNMIQQGTIMPVTINLLYPTPQTIIGARLISADSVINVA